MKNWENIIRFPVALHPSSQKHEGPMVMPEPQMIADFFQYLRGIGPDAFMLKHYPTDHNQAPTQLIKGYIPDDQRSYRQLYEHQVKLEQELDDHYQEAAEYIGSRISRIYQKLIHGYAMIFVKSADGLIGSGWYDNAHTPHKGFKMASFMIYALGSMNKSVDPDLLTTVYTYLPYDGEFTREESEVASEIIASALLD